MKKTRVSFLIDIDLIIILLVSCILLGAGAFAVYTMTDTLGISDTTTKSFTVTDPTIDQNCNMGADDLTITSVRQHLTNGSWVTIDPGDYTYARSTVTVFASALYG